MEEPYTATTAWHLLLMLVTSLVTLCCGMASHSSTSICWFVGFIRDHLQNVGVERMERPASSPDLNPIEHLLDQLGRAVRARLTNATTLADL